MGKQPFGLDLEADQPKPAGIALATYGLFAGVIEFGLMRRLSNIVTVTNARMERILQRVGWPLRRLGQPRSLGKPVRVAGYLSVSRETLPHLSRAAGLSAPVIAPAAEQRRRVA